MDKAMKSKTLDDLAAARRVLGRTQKEFWSLFGITQSGGARYENGRPLPRSVQMLIWLSDNARISDSDLADAAHATKARTQKGRTPP